MDRRTLIIVAIIVVAAAAGAVGAIQLFRDSDQAGTTTTQVAASTSSSTTTSATTTSTTTTSTTAPTAGKTIELSLPESGDLALAAQAFYAWVGDPAAQDPPAMAEGLAAFLAGVAPEQDLTLEGEIATGDLPDGSRVAVVAADEDVLLAVDDGAGWRIVGAKLTSLGLGPWYGDPVRFIMAIGTDARPGESERGYRGDSLHLLVSNIGEGTGTVMGFPRDTRVQAPYGGWDKLTHVNARADSAALVQVVRDITGLPVEGYLVTGFRSFINLVDAFGGVRAYVPFAMMPGDEMGGGPLGVGEQLLGGDDALLLSRNRSIPGGDFARTAHQGLIMLGALDKVLSGDILALPGLLELLTSYTWTDLSAEALLTAAAGAYELDPELVENFVLPGTGGMVGSSWMVILDDSVEETFRDLEDGVLTTQD